VSELPVAENTLVGRVAGGHVDDLISTDIWPILGALSGSQQDAHHSGQRVDGLAVPTLTEVNPTFDTWLGTGSRTVTDGVVNGTTTVTSATANFTTADVGSGIFGNTNLSDGGSAPCTIVSINSATSVEISNAASGSASGQTLIIDSLFSNGGSYLNVFKPGIYAGYVQVTFPSDTDGTYRGLYLDARPWDLSTVRQGPNITNQSGSMALSGDTSDGRLYWVAIGQTPFYAEPVVQHDAGHDLSVRVEQYWYPLVIF
jgi:hypothetical protein